MEGNKKFVFERRPWVNLVNLNDGWAVDCRATRVLPPADGPERLMELSQECDHLKLSFRTAAVSAGSAHVKSQLEAA